VLTGLFVVEVRDRMSVIDGIDDEDEQEVVTCHTFLA
jgi:hypothetical protein